MTFVYPFFSLYIYLFGYTPDLLLFILSDCVGAIFFGATSLSLLRMGLGSVL